MAQKKVQSTTVSLWDILNTTTPFSIPYNQRPYTWELKNWETLWNSFFSDDDRSSFLGSFIFLVNEDPEQPIQVFDGQQRITTLTILCKAFIDILYANKFVEEASKIHRFAILDFDDEPKLFVSKNIRKYFVENFQKSIECKAQQGDSIDEKNVYKAYNYFYRQAEELLKNNENDGKEVYDLFKKRLSNLEVVKLTISDVLLGIEIFESVNATGKKLNASELAKNILIKHAELSTTHDIENIDSAWLEINERLLKTGFSFIDFMHYYWLTKYRPVGKSHLFDDMKKQFRGDSTKWLEFFTELEKSSITFENIFNCYSFETFSIHYPFANANPKYHEKYLRYLRCLTQVHNKSWIMPIFTLLDYESKLNEKGQTYIGKNKFHDILKKHFVFSFLHFNIYSLPTRDFTPAMYRLSKGINQAISDFPQDMEKSNAAVNKCFQEHFNGQESYVKKTVKLFKSMELEFQEGLFKLTHNDNNKFLIHNLFGDIEEYIFGGTFHNIPRTSIEHYMPQESDSSWGIPKEISREHENRLGNILIIDAALNGKLQNKSHTDKMEILIGHSSNNNFTNNFVENNESSTGLYNFGKITKEQLSKSNPIDSPSEIDKRTAQISGYIQKMYIADFKY